MTWGKRIVLYLLVLIYSIAGIFFSVHVFSSAKQDKEYIKWVEFNPTYSAMKKAMDIDIKSQEEEVHIDWIEVLAYLGAKYGGDFKSYKEADMNKLVDQLKSGITMDELCQNMKYYNYYKEAYSAVLGGFVGEYEVETAEADNPNEKTVVKKYGLKAFSPIAQGYYFNDYDDFGASRSYGYRRQHLGHDLMGNIGTPVIAIESGIAECVGWNQYGGWRIGIRSFDGKRYYYYAHLRKDHPYNDMYEGKVVTAGDVIGYLGNTGYSAKENVSNIEAPHLHFGLQLIFDESQKEGNNEIWINMYELTKLLRHHTSPVQKQEKEYNRVYELYDPCVPE